MTRRSCSPIGLDIGVGGIAAAQMVRRQRRWRLETAALIPRPVGSPADRLTLDEAPRLADILERLGFVGRRTVAAAPQSRLMLSVLDLPPRDSGAPIDELARVEMSRTHRREAGSFELACWDLPAPLRTTEGTHLMAAALAHEDAAAVLDPIEESGLVVEALDTRAWAMARACERPLAGSSDAAALLDVAEQGAVLALVRGGAVVYERSMPEAGLAVVRKKLVEALALDGELIEPVFATLLNERSPGGDGVEAPPEAGPLLEEHVQLLVQEMRTALGYVVHKYGGEVARILVHGPGAVLRGLAGRLASELGLGAEPARPGELVECAPMLGDAATDPALAVAIGLAKHPVASAA